MEFYIGDHVNLAGKLIESLANRGLVTDGRGRIAGIGNHERYAVFVVDKSINNFVCVEAHESDIELGYWSRRDRMLYISNSNRP